MPTSKKIAYIFKLDPLVEETPITPQPLATEDDRFMLDPLVEKTPIAPPLATENGMHEVLAEFMEQDIADAVTGVIAIGAAGLSVVPVVPEIVVTRCSESGNENGGVRVRVKAIAVHDRGTEDVDDDGTMSDADTLGDKATRLMESVDLQRDKDIDRGDGGGMDGAQVDGVAEEGVVKEEDSSCFCGCLSVLGEILQVLGSCVVDCVAALGRDDGTGGRVRHAPLYGPIYPLRPAGPSSRSHTRGTIPALQGYNAVPSNDGMSQGRSPAVSSLQAVQYDYIHQVDGYPTIRQDGAQQQFSNGYTPRARQSATAPEGSHFHNDNNAQVDGSSSSRKKRTQTQPTNDQTPPHRGSPAVKALEAVLERNDNSTQVNGPSSARQNATRRNSVTGTAPRGRFGRWVDKFRGWVMDL